MNEINTPFEPPVTFMQTGNQHVSLEPPTELSNSLGPNETSAHLFESNPIEAGSEITNDLFNLNAPQTQTTKYAIFDMFWLINQKFYKKIQLIQNEAHFVVISFNMSFGNLRVSFFNLTNNSIQNNIVYLENLKRTVTATIYPSTAFNVVNTQRLAVTCLEQLFRQIPGANWQQERPVCKIEKNEFKLRLTVADPKNGTYFYDFEDWQYHAMIKSLEFTFTKGFELTASYQHLK